HQHLTLPRPSGQNPYGTIATAPAELPDGYGWSNVWGQMQITHPTLPPSNPPTTSPVISSASATAGYGYGLGGNSQEVNQYFYHPDHLGSATYVTGRDGRVRQHIEYTAFGETFVEEHTSSDTQPYLYNGKELDSETGLYYYGARYYDPVASIWASVDPMAEKYAGMTPFAYGLQNPIRYSDPDGMDALETVSNLSVGFADAMTFGLTSKFNKYVMGTGDYTNTQSDAYKLGDAIGTAFNVVLSAGGKAVGEKALGITIEAAATAVNAGIEMKEGNLRPTEFIVNKVAEKGFEKVGGLAVKDIDAAKITDFGKKFVEKATGAYVDKFMNGVMPSKNDDKREFEKRLKQIGDPTPPSVRPIE
ncbi:MAG TPA: RHS repeat-associated core domain-containing protein, partial [Flavobacteriales bacterium]|nr:RHS repeat-associated core domain-containing protein [Flavobacteriales bacterium]